MKKHLNVLLLLVLSTSLLAFRSDDLPVFEGTSELNYDKTTLDEVSKEIEKLDAGYKTKLGKTYLQDRVQLREEIKKALRKLSISSVLYEKEFDISGKTATFKIRPKISSERMVRLVNEGQVNGDDTPGTFRTKYAVSTKVTVEKQTGVSVRLSDNSDFNPNLNLFVAETGVSVQKIAYVNSLKEYLEKSEQDKDSLLQIIGSRSNLQNDFENEVNSVDNKIQHVEYSDSAQSKIGKLAQKVTIDEEFRIFLEGIFRDPKEIGKKLFKISAKELQDNSVLKPGETLIKTFYLRQTKPGFTLKNNLTGDLSGRFKLNRDHFTVLRVGFQKDLDGLLYVKTQFEEYPRWEAEGSVSLFISALKILRARYESMKLEAEEKLFMFDLNQTYAQVKINELFNRFGNPIRTKQEYQRLLDGMDSSDGSVVKLLDRTRNSVGNFETFTTRFEIGLLGSRSDDIKRVERSNTKDLNGKTSDEVSGTVESRNQLAARIFKLFRSKEDQIKRFRIFSRRNFDRSIETDLAFEYYINDSRTSEAEYENYINIAKTAFFLADSIKGESSSKMKEFLDNRLNTKVGSKNEQAVLASIYFSQNFVRRILSKDVSILKEILAEMILGEGKTWSDLAKIKNTSRDTKDCSKAVKGKYANLIYRGAILTCTRVKAVANTIVSTFEEAQKAGADHVKVSKVFTQLVDNRDVDQLVPFLMLQVGLIESVSGKEVVYANIDEIIENNELEMNVSFLGEDIKGVQSLRLGDVPTLQPLNYAHDFDLEMPLGKTSVVYTAQALADKNNLYLTLSSLFKFNEEFQVVGVLYSGTTPQALLNVDGLNVAKVSTRDENSSEYNYILKFPIVGSLESGKKYALSVYIVEKASGERVSEPVEVRFKLK